MTWDIPALLDFHQNVFGDARMEDAPPTDPPSPNEPEKTFTQAELDRVVAERLKRAKPADYDELKAAAKRLAEIEAANATDLEKAVKAARDEGRAEVQKAANARLISAEARAVAAELRFKNPALAIKAVDLTDIKVGEDGAVDGDAVRAALTKLATDEPYLVGDDKPAPPPSFAGGARGSVGSSDVDPGRARLRAAYAASTNT